MQQIDGDITKVITSGYILHQANCYGVMGAGVALAIRRQWPDVYETYHQYCKQASSPQSLFGKMQYVPATPTLTIINSFTQLGYGNAYRTGNKDTNEELLIANIKTAATKAADEGTTLAVPDHVGCGLAGGDWQTVFDGIKDIDNLIIVKYEPF